MNRSALLALVALSVACSKPRVVEPPASAPTATPSGAPVAAATSEEAAPNPALLLSDAELATYLDHVIPLATELATLDASFAAKARGTAVTWDNLVSPETATARDALAVRHGYASWSAFATVHNKVVGAMGLVVARALRAMSVGANMNRLKELEQQADEPALGADARARMQVALGEMKRRNDELKAKPIGSPNVPEANLEVLGKRQADLTRVFKDLRVALKPKPPVPTPAPAPAPAPTPAPDKKE